jgi:hypothetical protein
LRHFLRTAGKRYFSAPKRKGFHQTPFSLAAENAKLILLHCFEIIISFFYYIVKRKIVFAAKTVLSAEFVQIYHFAISLIDFTYKINLL